jgi:hypothetical protein
MGVLTCACPERAALIYRKVGEENRYQDTLKDSDLPWMSELDREYVVCNQ